MSPLADCLDLPPESRRPDPLQRPRNARATVERGEAELILHYPARSGTQYGARGALTARLFFWAMFLGFGIFGVCLGYKAWLEAQVFFQVFGPVKAVLWTIALVGCTSGGAIAYIAMYWGVANLAFTSWTLRIDHRNVCLTTRGFFTTRRRERELTDEVHAETVREHFGFHWRKWLRPSYWFDTEPAWGGHHFVLTTRPQTPFPYHNVEERDWLLRVIDDFLANPNTEPGA